MIGILELVDGVDHVGNLDTVGIGGGRVGLLGLDHVQFEGFGGVIEVECVGGIVGKWTDTGGKE
ncbi:hypothetical protein QR98_0081560 [Sarcoptes scabiei]|uniref:Uncharacterized protein n=1 Tax=Sarcoptes scabiei TaxID=52283 RepID=A0A132AFB4_SARSC|nr:hypothetical protein QR98_0081560 [Sarcoptes scabiei]